MKEEFLEQLKQRYSNLQFFGRFDSNDYLYAGFIDEARNTADAILITRVDLSTGKIEENTAIGALLDWGIGLGSFRA